MYRWPTRSEETFYRRTKQAQRKETSKGPCFVKRDLTLRSTRPAGCRKNSFKPASFKPFKDPRYNKSTINTTPLFRPRGRNNSSRYKCKCRKCKTCKQRTRAGFLKIRRQVSQRWESVS
eukprot:14276_6